MEKNGEDQLDRLSKSGKVLFTTKKKKNIIHKIKRRRVIKIDHLLRKNSRLKHVMERKKERRSDGKTRKKTQAATG